MQTKRFGRLRAGRLGRFWFSRVGGRDAEVPSEVRPRRPGVAVLASPQPKRRRLRAFPPGLLELLLAEPEPRQTKPRRARLALAVRARRLDVPPSRRREVAVGGGGGGFQRRRARARRRATRRARGGDRRALHAVPLGAVAQVPHFPLERLADRLRALLERAAPAAERSASSAKREASSVKTASRDAASARRSSATRARRAARFPPRRTRRASLPGTAPPPEERSGSARRGPRRPTTRAPASPETRGNAPARPPWAPARTPPPDASRARRRGRARGAQVDAARAAASADVGCARRTEGSKFKERFEDVSASASSFVFFVSSVVASSRFEDVSDFSDAS